MIEFIVGVFLGFILGFFACAMFTVGARKQVILLPANKKVKSKHIEEMLLRGKL